MQETDGEQDVKENGVDDGEHDDAQVQEGKESKKAASQSNKASVSALKSCTVHIIPFRITQR